MRIGTLEIRTERPTADGECALYESLIKPAILKLLADGEGGYRVERDLHHHLTVCLHETGQVRLGRKDRLVRYEEPTTAKYDWKSQEEDLSVGRKAGNVDFFFPVQPRLPRVGAALEVNFGYESTLKIQQDFIKLLDPRNCFRQAVYFAYGLTSGFKEVVQKGLEGAFERVRAYIPALTLPVSLYVLVAESHRGRAGGACEIWEADLTSLAALEALTWKKLSLGEGSFRKEQPVTTSAKQVKTESDDLYITRREAELILNTAMEEAGIPLRRITARCMFEPTKQGTRKICKFGPTPLWDNCLRVVNGKVLRSEFMDWVDRLTDSGHNFQKAGRASFASQARTYSGE